MATPTTPTRVRILLVPTLVFALTFLIPNLAILVRGLAGTFLTYLTWPVLIVIAVPLLLRSGKGYIAVLNSATIGLAMVMGLSALGIIVGFDVRRYPSNPVALLTNLGIFLITAIGVEVGRSALMSTARSSGIRLLLGTVGGLLLGFTIPATLSYFSSAYRNPYILLPDLLYSLVLARIHELGGLGSGVVFRLIAEGYWRFSPLTPTSTLPGPLRATMLALTYYAVFTYLESSVSSLRGQSRRLFTYSRTRRVASVTPEVVAVGLALLFFALAYIRFVPLVIVSGSMSPTLDIGDVVFIHAVGGSDISVGDVVAYIMDGRQVVVHRVVYVGSEGVRTKGDANPDPDPFIVDYRQIVGRVVFTLPRIGLVVLALHRYEQVSLWLITAAAMFLATYAWRYSKMRKLKLVF